jgi:hypothetical protein
MSLIVLNSKGQDPAEFENHFGRGIKLPKNAEICLVGSNINYKQNTEDETQISESNDTFVIQYGNVQQAKFNESGPYTVKIPHGKYKNLNLGAAIQKALNAGKFPNGLENSQWYKNQPISPLRNGITGTYDLATNKITLQVTTQTVRCGTFGGVNEQDQFNSDEDAKRSFFASTGCYRNYKPNNTTQLTHGQDVNITRMGIDHAFAEWTPSGPVQTNKQTQAVLSKYPCWTHNTGAAPLLPDGGIWGGTGGSINPYWMAGHHWFFYIPGTYSNSRDKIAAYMGGLVSQRKVGVTSWENGGVIEANNRQELIDNWANGGIKFDIWWEIYPTEDPPPAVQKWIVKYYYHPTNKPYEYGNRIQFGEGQILQLSFNQISLIPKAGTAGTDPQAPIAPLNADDFIWEGRYSSTTTVTTPTLTSSSPAILNGSRGYCVVTDGGDFDIYKYLPLYQGTVLKYQDDQIPAPFIPIGISTLRHGNSMTQPQSIYNGQPEPLDGGGGTEIIANNETPFRDVYFGFSPVREIPSIVSPFIDNKFRLMCDRECNIGKTLGFREDQLTRYEAGTTVAIESDFNQELWNEAEEVAIIQITNLPIEGSLGGGSSVWGGSNDAQIVGVAPIKILKNLQISPNNGQSIYTETSNENWIKLSNLTLDSLNQLKIKLTDPTGRKLINLSPNTTIWLKLRQGTHDNNLKGGDQSMSQSYGGCKYN